MKNGKGMEQQLFVCDCGDISHQFILSWYPEDGDWSDELYIQVHLNQSNRFWKRLWHGIKYVFGYKCRFGAFDEILLDKNSAARLRNSLDEFVQFNEKKKKTV